MLSIVIPYCNDGKEFIETTVNQIRDTINVCPYEIIVVDDHSDTPLELEGVKVLRHPSNLGVGASFDTGVKEAMYDNIILMGDDIRFVKNAWASKMVRHIEANPKALLCASCVKINRFSRCHNEEIVDGNCTKCGKPALDNMDFEHRRLKQKLNGATILVYHDSKSNPGAVPDNFRGILDAKWLPANNKETQPYEIPCVLGAFYGVKKSWYNYIEGWAGHKIWGGLEPMISLKSWLFGGSCIMVPDVEIAHIFRKKHEGRRLPLGVVNYNKILTALLLFQADSPRVVNFLPSEDPAVKTAMQMVFDNEDWIMDKMTEYDKKIVVDKEVFFERFGIDYRTNSITPEVIREEANGIYLNETNSYSKHYSESPYVKVWNHVAKYISPEETVCDVGCGPGQFMELMLDHNVKAYTGIDISPVAIGKACSLLSKRTDAHKASLVCTNILNGFLMPDADKYVLVEILEHLNQDKALLAKIPKGKEVILSVPSYLGGSHVRKFDNTDQVRERYGAIVEPEEITELQRGTGKIFVLKGTKT